MGKAVTFPLVVKRGDPHATRHLYRDADSSASARRASTGPRRGASTRWCGSATIQDESHLTVAPSYEEATFVSLLDEHCGGCRPTPQVRLGVSVTAAACGAAHSLAVSRDGAVYAWAFDGYSSLLLGGDLLTTRWRCPAGAVYAWGCGERGQLGGGLEASVRRLLVVVRGRSSYH